MERGDDGEEYGDFSGDEDGEEGGEGDEDEDEDEDDAWSPRSDSVREMSWRSRAIK